MGKRENFVVGAIVGTALGAVIGYIFGPAQGAVSDPTYRSRLDRALEEGERAEEARRIELEREFERAKRVRRPGSQTALPFQEDIYRDI